MSTSRKRGFANSMSVLSCACCILFAIAIAGCPAAPGGTDNGTYRLTLTMRTGSGDRRGMEVYVAVRDVVYTRLNAPLFDANSTTRYANNVDPDTFEQDIPAGKTVTLIATEFRGVTTTSELQDNPAAVEFLAFEGDTDNTPESGVASLTMDGDKNVAAVYAVMPRFVLRRENENNTQLSGGCFDFTLVAAPYLGTPGVPDISGSTEGICGDLSGYVKTGTRLTFTAVDVNGCDVVSGTCFEQFQRWGGSAAVCGGARDCLLVIGTDIDATAIWRDTR